MRTGSSNALFGEPGSESAGQAVVAPGARTLQLRLPFSSFLNFSSVVLVHPGPRMHENRIS